MSGSSRESSCGLLGCRPEMLQPLASKKMYMVLYGCVGVVQGMFFTYLTATVSTLERKFGIKSKEAAYLMSGNEISQFLFLFALPFLVKVKRRPMWMAIGLSCSAIGCFLMAMPHFISHQYEYYEKRESLDFSLAESIEEAEEEGLCGFSSSASTTSDMCDAEGNRKVDWSGLLLVFTGIVLTGVGNCAYYTFGLAYLDDNTSHDNSPIMLSITFTLKLLGPTLGFFLASVALRMYVMPDLDPGFEEGDPRFLGAWWLGYPIMGTLILIFALPLVCFPQRLPKRGTDADAHAAQRLNDTSMGLRDGDSFKAALMRLLHNKLFMFNFFSGLFYVFAFMGFGTFMPKYIEYTFRRRASEASSFVGGVGTLSKAIGLLVSGLVVARLKPSARFLSAYNVFIGLLFFILLVVFSMLGCPEAQIYGQTTDTGLINISSACNAHCDCPSGARLQPLCALDTNFYSPCEAGCRTRSRLENGSTLYSDCSCVQQALLEDTGDVHGLDVLAVDGWCTVDCGSVFALFIISTFVITVIASTGRIGNFLVALRCIAIQDKALSMAFNVVFMSLFAMLPSPVVYGAIIDNTCVLWQEECGENTNCLIYDAQSLRRSLMWTTAAIMFFGVLLDVGTWYYAKGLLIYSKREGNDNDNDIDEDNKEKAMNRYASNLSINKEAIFKSGSLARET